MTTEYTDHFRLNLPDFRTGPWHDLVNQDFVQIDDLLFGLYQGVNTQTWANNTHFIAGETAIDSVDNSFWVCIVEHTSAPTGTFAADRAAHPTYWNRVVVGIAPRGEWTHNTHYLPNDMVTSTTEHIIAICKTEHTSNAAGTIRDDAAYWTYLADIGSAQALAQNVTYTNTTSGSAYTQLQATTDDLYAKHGSQQTTINANTAAIANQGPRITALEASDGTQNTNITANTNHVNAVDTRLTNLEGSTATNFANNTTKDNAQDVQITNLTSNMAGKLSDAPSDGTTYARKNAGWIDVLSVAGASVLIGDVPPAGARDSSLWWESDTGQLYILYNDGDSSQWVCAVPQLDAGLFIRRDGDTMTGDLTISKTNALLNFNQPISATDYSRVRYNKNGLPRWDISGAWGTESGSNTGSDWSLDRYNDAGVYLNSPITVYRSSAVTEFAGDVLIKKATPSLSLGKTASGQHALIYGTLNGANRWAVSCGNTTPESGSNVGSDFSIYRYTDAGAYVGEVLGINRANAQATFAGAVLANSSIWSALTATTGTYQFGTSGSKYLGYDGSNFVFSGAQLVVNSSFYGAGGITSAISATTGTYSFGNSGTKYLTFDGTNFTLGGGQFIVNSNFFVSGSVNIGNGGSTGIAYFGNTGSKYLQYDGSSFQLFGGGILVNGGGINCAGSLAGTGHVCRTGVTGTNGGSAFNTNWTGSALSCWVDATNLGTFNITSDYRIKSNVKNAAPALSQVMKWRPITYTGRKWGVFEKNNNVRHSFIAHELQAVSPDCVLGEKDAEQPQTLDLVPIVARLTKALQEAVKRIEVLEARLV